mgnify:FL=1
MAEVIRIEDERQQDLAHRYMFGLNLFAYNKVVCPIEERPDVRFLMHLTERIPCGAQVGAVALKDLTNSPDEMFGPPDGATPYVTAGVGFSDGFFDLGEGIPFEGNFVEGRFEAYAQEEAHFAVLEPSLSYAVESVTASNWF